MEKSNFIKNFKNFEQMVNVILSSKFPNRYTYIDNEKFYKTLLKNVAKGNEIYCIELLYRAHNAAMTTILRKQKWAQGIDSAIKKPNYFVFCASLRGLLESAADSVECLINVPITIANNYSVLSAGLKKKIDNSVVCCEELENCLLHYSHAKKQPKGTDLPDHFKAKTSQEYLKFIEEPDRREIRDLYAELCQLTHPAEQTVSIFITKDNEKSEEYILQTDLDTELIFDLCSRHDDAFPNIFQKSLNAALITLYALNQFRDQRIYTAGIDQINLSNIKAFKEVQNAFCLN